MHLRKCVKDKMEIREELADLEHKQWIHWTKYFLANYKNYDNLVRWEKQTQLSYKELSEKEKDADRVWADKVLKLMIKMIDEKINFYTGKNMTFKEKMKRNLETGEAGHKSVALIKLKSELLKVRNR